MTRSEPDPQLARFDPEIERTLRQLRQTRRQLFPPIEPSEVFPLNSNFEIETAYTSPELSDSSVSFSGSSDYMADQGRTLKELAAPDMFQQPLGIVYPDLEVDFELKSGLIHLLPKFHGHGGEDPHKHLKEFHVVCSNMRPLGVDEDQVKLRAFPFSLEGNAKDWLFYLPHGAANSWAGLRRLFLEKYFPASRAAAIRKDICGIRQLQGETLYEYWERFKRLCASCPHHQIPEQLLIQYFYEGLIPMDRSMIDAASGGALVDKTPAAARALIENMAENSQQFGSRAQSGTRSVHGVAQSDSPALQQTLEEISGFMKQLTLGQVQLPTPAPAHPTPAMACGICSCHTHTTDACPQLIDDSPNVSAANVFPGRPQNQQQYNPYSNTYNPGWRDHPNMRWGNSSNQQFQNQPPFQQQQRYQPPHHRQPQPQPQLPPPPQIPALPPPAAASDQPTMQEMMKLLLEMRTEINQMKSSSSQAQQSTSSQIPSQTIPNPKGNVSSLTLRSGTVLPEVKKPHEEEKQEEPKEVVEEDAPVIDEEKQPLVTPVAEETIPISLPFPQKATSSKRPTEVELDKDLLETFKKVEVNIPLLDAIKQIPKYAKFLKELCTNKRRLKGNEKVNLGVHVSSIINPSLPQKCKDPGTFTIPCTIGNMKFGEALADLGAGINVMPRSVYRALHVGELKPTGVILQFANRSIQQPDGLLEDVLVRVNDLIFPADFYVLEMAKDEEVHQHTLILGRPFLKTAKAKVDVYAGTLSLECGDLRAQFNLHDAMRFPTENHSAFAIDLIDSLIENAYGDLVGNPFGMLEFENDFSCPNCDGISDLCKECAEIDASLAENAVDSIAQPSNEKHKFSAPFTGSENSAGSGAVTVSL